MYVCQAPGKGLVTNSGEGGLHNGRGGGGGGQVKFYPYEKGEAEKVLALHKVLG